MFFISINVKGMKEIHRKYAVIHKPSILSEQYLQETSVLSAIELT